MSDTTRSTRAWNHSSATFAQSACRNPQTHVGLQYMECCLAVGHTRDAPTYTAEDRYYVLPQIFVIIDDKDARTFASTVSL
jgi:hypothetical protein